MATITPPGTFVPVADIVVGERFRQDMGDLHGLAESIQAHGMLLHPILISSSNKLIVGERRLRAVRDVLGLPTIQAHIVDLDALLAEQDENKHRKQFTISEQTAICAELDRKVGPRQGKWETLPGTCPEVPIAQGQETRDAVARAAGLGSDRTRRHAEAVLANGTPELVAAMDAGTVPVSTAAEIAGMPAGQQKKVVAQVAAGKRPRAAVREVTEKKKSVSTDEMLDGTGQPVPQSLRDVFGDTSISEAAENLAGQAIAICTRAHKAVKAKHSFFPYLRIEDFFRHLDEAKHALTLASEALASGPADVVCPTCHGKGCKDCRKCGHMPMWRYEELKEEGADHD